MITKQELLTLTDFMVDELADVGFRGPRTLVAIGRVGDELRVGIWGVAPGEGGQRQSRQRL
jgi:hypothetical protein